MKKQNVRQNAGQTTRMENKSVSSKVTIRNSTTLIERSETGKEKQKPETNDYEETFLKRHIMEKGVSVYVSQQIKDEIACVVVQSQATACLSPPTSTTLSVIILTPIAMR